MTAVYVLRHPQTTWNMAKRYQGRLEAPLSREGVIQMRLAVRAFAGQTLDAVMSSPLKRAVSLAREIAEATDAPLCLDQRLTELAVGPWEGLYLDQIKQRYSDQFQLWHTHPSQVQFAHGESLADVRRRVASFLNYMSVRYPRGNVAVVTHSTVVRVMAADALGLDLDHIHRIPATNAAITTLWVDQAPGRLLCLNDTDALYHSPVAAAAEQNCPPTEATI